jgi:hypothetical protein
MLGEGLRLAAADIKPLQFEIPETKARSANKGKIVNLFDTVCIIESVFSQCRREPNTLAFGQNILVKVFLMFLIKDLKF